MDESEGDLVRREFAEARRCRPEPSGAAPATDGRTAKRGSRVLHLMDDIPPTGLELLLSTRRSDRSFAPLKVEQLARLLYAVCPVQRSFHTSEETEIPIAPTHRPVHDILLTSRCTPATLGDFLETFGFSILGPCT